MLVLAALLLIGSIGSAGSALTARAAGTVLTAQAAGPIESVTKTAAGTGDAAGAADEDAEIREFSDLNGRMVSMLNGAPFEEMVRSKVPDVGGFSYFNNMPDLFLALKAGKTDAAFTNNAVGALIVNRDPALALIPESLSESRFGYAFAKGDPLRDQWQAAYDAIPQETIEALWEKWTGTDESAKVMPAQDWPGEGGTVKVAACDTLEPMSYAGQGGELIGFDIELVLTMAKELDVHVEFTGMEFSAVLSAVQSGRAQMAAGSIVITPERSQAVDFLAYYPAAFMLVVRNPDWTGAEGLNTTQSVDAVRPSYTEFEGKRIAILTGTNFPEVVAAVLPGAEQIFYNSVADTVSALQSDKVDAVALDEPVARNVCAEFPETVVAEGYLDAFDYAFICAKTPEGEALRAELSAFLTRLTEDGTRAALEKKWFDGVPEESLMTVDPMALPAENGTLRIAAMQYPPFDMVGQDMVFGYEPEILGLFAKEQGYAVEFVIMNADAIISAVQSGRCDIGATGIAVTEERKESVYFTEPTYSGGVALLALRETAGSGGVAGGGDGADGSGTESAVGGTSFFASVRDSFDKTFVREERYKLFLSGIGTTLSIVVLSVLFGTALGALLFMLCRRGNPVALTLARFYSWLMGGMPVVVLLMILYYIVFGRTAVSGAAVSVLGFTLILGAQVYGLLSTAVGSVDKGQMEAAYALGYTDRRAFFRHILPQALPQFMPGYRSGIVSLIKSTSVVGYVAVQDLTKMGDIIRSRTYDAFFPLIAVAIIYFILAGILVWVVDRVTLRLDPTRRDPSKILQGVKTND